MPDNGRPPNDSERTAEQRARDLLERAGVEDAQSYTAGDLVEIANLLAEVDRLRAGRFTKDEIHDICHNLHGTVSAEEFADGCAEEQRKLYGCAPDRDRLEHMDKRAAVTVAYLQNQLAGIEQRWRALKGLTKAHPASQWDEHYKALAERIHAMGRDFFYVR